jgi:NADPH:quinone reductase-like Zn-dependent oxidoreductase
MKRVVVDHFGGPEVLRVVEEDAPRPGPGEVRVRVLAAGVSFTDALIRAGTTSAARSRRSRPATSWSAWSRSSGRAVRGCERETASGR